jgi:hypothetical protein
MARVNTTKYRRRIARWTKSPDTRVCGALIGLPAAAAVRPASTSLVSHSYVHLSKCGPPTALATVSYADDPGIHARGLHNPQHLAVGARLCGNRQRWVGYGRDTRCLASPTTAIPVAPRPTGLWVALYSLATRADVQMSVLNAVLCGVFLCRRCWVALNADDKCYFRPSQTLPIVALTAYWSANHTYLRSQLSSVRTLVALCCRVLANTAHIMLFSALILYAHAHALTAMNTAMTTRGAVSVVRSRSVCSGAGNLVVRCWARGQHSTVRAHLGPTWSFH